MSLKTKPSTDASPSSSPSEETRQPKSNSEIEARLNPFISDNQERHGDYQKVVREDPNYAARLLSLKDMYAVEREHRLNVDQIAGAKQWLESQPPATQENINQRLEGIAHQPSRDMKLAQAVDNHMRFATNNSLRAAGRAVRESQQTAKPSTGMRAG